MAGSELREQEEQRRWRWPLAGWGAVGWAGGMVVGEELPASAASVVVLTVLSVLVCVGLWLVARQAWSRGRLTE